ncbi:serine/threonine-protein kinase [Streptomyces cylindrosporus]|uniref:non-specific serine/threonine protein kinase n=1 Tax=Streptomyces cylindrosporus TaxID=2927583 RepID=A0ABS9YFT1_9ACTN|nr:serine/threonine-protein kinase [Streptomyces cylindrosporus]MCI3276095.1 protein kinase [Streptomyces cylindrosporus]
MSAGGEQARESRLLGGRYRLTERIGSGGMGTVWQAYDELVGRDVAVKQPRLPGDPEDEHRRRAASRLHREARAAARVDHPAAVSIHDVVVDDDGLPWIVMELIRGESLHEILRRGPVDTAEAARIGLAVLGALHAAHSVGIVHRDVKPANVLLGPHGRVVLTDFGIAHVQGEESLTASGEFVGSLEFVAPERMSGRSAGPPSDLWSLGVLLYAAVEGASPFRRPTVESTLAAVLASDPPEPKQAGPLGPLIARLLMKEPAGRPGAQECAAVLEAVTEGRPTPGTDGGVTGARDASRLRELSDDSGTVRLGVKAGSGTGAGGTASGAGGGFGVTVSGPGAGSAGTASGLGAGSGGTASGSGAGSAGTASGLGAGSGGTASGSGAGSAGRASGAGAGSGGRRPGAMPDPGNRASGATPGPGNRASALDDGFAGTASGLGAGSEGRASGMDSGSASTASGLGVSSGGRASGAGAGSGGRASGAGAGSGGRASGAGAGSGGRASGAGAGSASAAAGPDASPTDTASELDTGSAGTAPGPDAVAADGMPTPAGESGTAGGPEPTDSSATARVPGPAEPTLRPRPAGPTPRPHPAEPTPRPRPPKPTPRLRPAPLAAIAVLLVAGTWVGASHFSASGGKDVTQRTATLTEAPAREGGGSAVTWTARREPAVDAVLYLPERYRELYRVGEAGDPSRLSVYNDGADGVIGVQFTEWTKAPAAPMAEAKETAVGMEGHEHRAGQYTATTFHGDRAALSDVTYDPDDKPVRVLKLVVRTADDRMYQLQVQMPKGTPDEKKGTALFKGARDRLVIG